VPSLSDQAGPFSIIAVLYGLCRWPVMRTAEDDRAGKLLGKKISSLSSTAINKGDRKWQTYFNRSYR
jgi:hypothetical protein